MKKILVIMPKYYEYEKVIEIQLQKMDFAVEIVYENIDHVSLFYGFLTKYLGDFGKKSVSRFLKKEISRKGRGANYILVVRGSTIGKEEIDLAKSIADVNVKTYLYQWDSVKNNQNALEISKYFDKVSTFDMCDADKYGWNYRPLFYSFKTQSHRDRKYELAYICTLHSKRAYIFNLLKCDTTISPKYLFMYSERFHFIKQKYIKKNSEYTNIQNKDVKHHSLRLEETNRIMADSKIIIDYTHPNQFGYTMRTIESIGNKCKLVTNNTKIVDSDFYCENNVYIYNENNFYIPDYFVETEYKELLPEIYEKYSVERWIREIIDYEN